eukprot:scaffold13719_cov67-Isochrysis_galbana.AAC.2
MDRSKKPAAVITSRRAAQAKPGCPSRKLERKAMSPKEEIPSPADPGGGGQVGHPAEGLDDGVAVEQLGRLGHPVVVEEDQVGVQPHDLK